MELTQAEKTELKKLIELQIQSLEDWPCGNETEEKNVKSRIIVLRKTMEKLGL